MMIQRGINITVAITDNRVPTRRSRDTQHDRIPGIQIGIGHAHYSCHDCIGVVKPFDGIAVMESIHKSDFGCQRVG